MIPQATSNAKNPLEEGQTDIPNVKVGSSAELWPQERVQKAQVKFNEKNPLGSFLVKVQQVKEAQWECWKALMQWV